MNQKQYSNWFAASYCYKLSMNNLVQFGFMDIYLPRLSDLCISYC